MSCADVMYQPYSPYFPYHQRSQVAVSSGAVGPLTSVPAQVTADYRKFALVKSHTDTSPSSLDPTPSGSPVDCRPLPAAVGRTPSGSAAAASASAEEKAEKQAEAQYLSANCVLFTFYSGDISSVVDEHFARALSQATSYAAPPEAAATVSKGQQTKDGPPMSHRNFPPSFWNSNYQPMSNSANLGGMGGPSSLGPLPPDLSSYGGPDPYHPGTLSLHHPQNDPWHYTLTGHQGGHPFHRSAHELTSYHPGMSTVTGASRFGPQYGSLLLQPAVRSAARAAAACASLEKSEGWASTRYHDPIGHMDSNYGAAYGAMTPMTGLEGQPQESKDLYWF